MHYGRCTGSYRRAVTQQRPAAVTTNKNTKVRSFKSRENKKEGSPDCTFENNKFFLVTVHELTINTVISSFNKAVNLNIDLNSNGVQL